MEPYGCVGAWHHAPAMLAVGHFSPALFEACRGLHVQLHRVGEERGRLTRTNSMASIGDLYTELV